MSFDEYGISFLGSANEGFHGVWAVPGDDHWRQARDREGKLICWPSPYEAIADAASRMVRWLNEQQVCIDKEFNLTQAGNALGNAREFVEGLVGKQVDTHA